MRHVVAAFLVASVSLPAQSNSAQDKPPAAAHFVTYHDPAGKQLVDADVAIRGLATGMGFVEGPVWLADEAMLVFSDIPRQRLMGYSEAKGLCEVATTEGANGNTLDLEGRLISCQHGARNVVRRERDGTLTVLADRFEGRRLNSPNDVGVRGDGSVWFTDPDYGLAGREAEQAGRFVYRIDPKTREVTVVLRDFDRPNGLCFSPDGGTLYIADSGKGQRVGAFPVLKGGRLGEPSWIVGGSDGMRCDEKGNLWTTAKDGVRAYSKTGQHLVTIALPEQPANLAFGEADRRTLFVTARTSLYALRVHVPGLRVPPDPKARVITRNEAVLHQARVDKTETDFHLLFYVVKERRVRTGALPASIEELVVRDANGRSDVAEVPRDAWGMPYRLVLAPREGVEFELASAGPDGVFGTADDVVRAPAK
jgi:gluconolactonase